MARKLKLLWWSGYLFVSNLKQEYNKYLLTAKKGCSCISVLGTSSPVDAVSLIILRDEKEEQIDSFCAWPFSIACSVQKKKKLVWITNVNNTCNNESSTSAVQCLRLALLTKWHHWVFFPLFLLQLNFCMAASLECSRASPAWRWVCYPERGVASTVL